MTNKTFPTLMVASTMTGIGLCEMKFSDIHEIATHLAGHDVWTHELGSGPVMHGIQSDAYQRFPDMPSEAEARADYLAAGAKAVTAYGDTMTFAAGTLSRGEHPLDTLREMAPHADVVVAEVSR